MLENRPDLRREQLIRMKELMNAHTRDALVEGYEGLIETVTLPDPDDRHVLAAVIHAQADWIVTFNLRDFPARALAPHGIVAIHPDVFFLKLLEQDAQRVHLAAERQRTSLKNPPKTQMEYWDIMEAQGLPQTVQKLREAA